MINRETRRYGIRLSWQAGIAVLSVVLGTILPSLSHAQTYPERPITLVVPFPPGGGNDSIARELGGFLQQKLGKPIIVDNRGGAGGAIGAGQVARAEPDGYTLLFASSTFVTHAVVDKKTPYNVTEGFTPIALLGRGPLMVVVNKETNITSIQQLIERAKAEPDALNYCTTGIGSINHLATEAFVQKAEAKMTHVPYKGSGPAITDLLGGQIQVFFATVPAIYGQVRADQVRLLATTGKDRPKAFPDIPTVAESVSGYDVQTWWSIVGPAGLPPDIVAKLNQAINEATASEAMQKRFDTEGAESFQGKPEDLTNLLREQMTYFRQVAQAAGL